LGFKALGMSVFPCYKRFGGTRDSEKIASMQYAVIYITEQFAKDIVSTIDKYKDHKLPAIIPIPGNQGSLGIGMMNIKKSVERAVGADILSGMNNLWITT